MTIRDISKEYAQYWCEGCDTKEGAAYMAAQDTAYAVIGEIENWLSSADLSKGRNKLIEELHKLFK